MASAATYSYQNRPDPGDNVPNTSDSLYYPAEPLKESDLYVHDGHGRRTISEDVSILVPSPIPSKHNTSDQASLCELDELKDLLRKYLHNTLLTDGRSWDAISDEILTTYLSFCKNENLTIGTTMALVYHLCFHSLYNQAPSCPMDLTWDKLRKLTKEDDERSMKKIVQDISGDGSHITNPYDLYPRRLWDLYTNRVIPTYLVQAQNGDIKIKFMAITHSWVETKHQDHVLSDINEYAWPITLPKGVSLRKIRQDIFSQAPGLRYCWLDVLCNRQTGYPFDRKPNGSGHVEIPASQAGDALGLQQDFGGEAKVLRNQEWELDLPTMGNIYQKAIFTLRYFNGLGRDFSDKGWDDPNHWLNRVWTLQESVGVMVDITILAENQNSTSNAAGYGPLHIWGKKNGQYKPMRYFVQEVEGVVRDLEIDDRKNKRSIMALAREMKGRFSGMEVDQISGLSHLLNFPVLPTYKRNATVEEAWERCLRHMPDSVKLELVFTCPLSHENHWYPSWEQLRNCPPPRVKYTGPISPRFGPQLANNSNPLVDIFPKFRITGYALHHCEVTYKEWQKYQPDNSQEDVNGAKNGHYEVTYEASPNAILFFFNGHDGPNIPDGNNYTLICPSILPCSTWVVLRGTHKVGVLRSDEFFADLVSEDAYTTVILD